MFEKQISRRVYDLLGCNLRIFAIPRFELAIDRIKFPFSNSFQASYIAARQADTENSSEGSLGLSLRALYRYFSDNLFCPMSEYKFETCVRYSRVRSLGYLESRLSSFKASNAEIIAESNLPISK